ncbi:protein TIC 20-I, chloroplastic-like [Wolffia australiana]
MISSSFSMASGMAGALKPVARWPCAAKPQLGRVCSSSCRAVSPRALSSGGSSIDRLAFSWGGAPSIRSPSVLPEFGAGQQRRQRGRAARASKDVPTSFRFPAMTKKPRWWWRTLACIPYLMPLHETWMYAETAYHLHPFLEDLEFLTYPFLGFIGRLPSWFLMAYFFAAYLGVVRKKMWPHFFRFHVVMGMLLEIALQVIGTISRWMPLAVYWGKLGMHFWTAVAFAYLFTVLECMRCALAGMYADIPFVCDAAYIQIPYD